ncbi:HMA domain-containing protein [Psidium guajava]|nr:HMA domain-containing protein [Psidium guajava]
MLKQQGPPRLQTFVLRVNIHCDGCRKKVKKRVLKISGVKNISIDAELGKVTVTGHVDPRTVIKKLWKSGKHAELWRAQEKSFHNQNHLNHQFKNMQIEFPNGNGGERDKNFQKGGGGIGFGHVQPKGSKDMMQIVPKAKKSITFDFDEDEEDYASEDSFCDSDDEDDFELDLGPHTLRKPSAMGGGGANGQTGTKGMKKAKKGGIFRIPMLGKGQGKKNEGKYGKGGKNDKYGGKNGKNSFNGRNPKQSGPKNGAINRNYGNGGRGGGGKSDWANGTKKMDPGFDIDFTNPGKRRGGAGRGGGGGGGAPVRQIGNYPMGHQGRMGSFPAVEGLPAPVAMNGGGYGPMAGPGNAYNQQHHMAMMTMINQQRARGNEMLRPMPMMYGGGPHPMMNHPYHHPMPMTTTAPRGFSDPYTHMFSDENTESCSIM